MCSYKDETFIWLLYYETEKLVENSGLIMEQMLHFHTENYCFFFCSSLLNFCMFFFLFTQWVTCKINSNYNYNTNVSRCIQRRKFATVNRIKTIVLCNNNLFIIWLECKKIIKNAKFVRNILVKQVNRNNWIEWCQYSLQTLHIPLLYSLKWCIAHYCLL